MTAETGNLREIEGKFVLQPVDSISGAASQDTDEVVTGKVAGLHAGQQCVTLNACMSVLTERLVSSKKVFALSGMPSSC